MDKGNNDRETHDFMNVKAFSQPPTNLSTPKEKSVKIFGIEFNRRHVVDVSSVEGSDDNIIICGDTKRNMNNNNNNNRSYKCDYCYRTFPTSQAMGGHQNAHRKEREHARRAYLHFNNVYGLVNYHRSLAVARSTTLTSSAAARFYGIPHSPEAPINGSLLAMSRVSAAPNNVPMFGSYERSLLNPLPLVAGDEMREGWGGSVGGGVCGGSHQARFDQEEKTMDQVSLDLHL